MAIYHCFASEMTDKEARLKRAIRMVAETKRLIAERQQRIEKLRAARISTADAEKTLEILCSSLPLAERHEKFVGTHPKK
jgi:hypothetical protein